MESQIIEFLPTDNKAIEVELDEQLQYIDKGTRYQFVETPLGLGLSQIELMHNKEVIMQWNPVFLLNNQTGEFSVCLPAEMGYISGTYQVLRNDNKAEISLVPDRGWVSFPKTFTTKMILSPKSIFCNWCKNYKYSAEIELDQLSINAHWKNGNK